ncbi:MAG: hypothetical protein BGN88_06905 [Clostridiales bacterium 43-6]|nr:MAG: hypothetical protein BGN88_06905 [Clostridiales bacterium 43-6]
MTEACFAIVAILLAMSFIFLRTGKKGYALGTIPLVFVPGMYIFASAISSVPKIVDVIDIEIIYTLAVVTGMIVACIAYGIFASKIHKKSSRTAYLMSCGGFTLLLSIMLLLYLFKK